VLNAGTKIRSRVRAAAGVVGQHTNVMGVVYVITLGIAMVGARLATI
jgi:hypothetical protein